MIGSLRGRVGSKAPPQLTVEVGGVGYEVEAPLSTFFHLPPVGAEVQLLTHLVVREDAHVLYGFGTEEERRLFRSLIKVSGVGPKIANLTLAVGFGRPALAVDIHVHRVTNRWGYVATTTPEKTLAALAEILPERYWVEINERLVPFGKAICTGVAPRCSTCPLLSMCGQVGVTSHR